MELVQGEDMPRAALRNLYAAADAFVLPTRGEGWGLPIAEAMAMALPVIATNWSGPTALLSTDNSYPLSRELTPLPGGQAEACPPAPPRARPPRAAPPPAPGRAPARLSTLLPARRGTAHCHSQPPAALHPSRAHAHMGGKLTAAARRAHPSQPSVRELRGAMRTVLEHPAEAAARGARAREDMARWYTPSAVAALAWTRLRDAAAEACAKQPSHAACQGPHAMAAGESTPSTRPGL